MSRQGKGGALPLLPPLVLLPRELRDRWSSSALLRLHGWILVVTYAAFMAAAAYEGTLFLPGGIGVFQSPPFFAHLMAGIVSIPMVVVLFRRVERVGPDDDRREIGSRLARFLAQSRLKFLFFGVCFLVGAFALAYTIVLSSSYQIDIYDSTRFPLGFFFYLIVRIYLYLLCYPTMVSATAFLALALFLSIARSDARFKPFHQDGAGGFHLYFAAVDRPIYAVQSFAIAIALANYIGWGGIESTPDALSIVVPSCVTFLAVLLFLGFRLAVSKRRRAEIDRISEQQMLIYEELSETSEGDDVTSFVDRLEATERLLVMIRRERGKGLKKYLYNYAVLLLPLVAEFATPVVQAALQGI